MKAIGAVRKIDKQGRVVIPIEVIKMLDLNAQTPFLFFVEEDKMILKKYEPGCIFCQEVRNVEEHKGKNICNACLDEIKNR